MKGGGDLEECPRQDKLSLFLHISKSFTLPAMPHCLGSPEDRVQGNQDQEPVLGKKSHCASLTSGRWKGISLLPRWKE